MNRQDIELKCVNADGQKVLKLGELYMLDKYDSFENRIYIKEYKRFSFLKSRFEVVK